MRDVGSLTIAINALSATMGGGISVARALATHLAEAQPAHRWLLYYSDEAVVRDGMPASVEPIHVPRLRSMLRRSCWEQLTLPTELERRGVDAVLNLGGFTCFATGRPQVSVWQNANVFSPKIAPRPLSLEVYIRLQRAAQWLSMRKARQNVFLTHHSLELAAGLWHMEDLAPSVIHSGVDDVSVDPQAITGKPTGPPIALSIGFTYFHKNYETLLRAINLYRRRHDEPLRLVIIGGAFDIAYHESIRALIGELGLRDLVEMTGELPRARVADWLGRASVYVTTSLLETFGLTLLEAMAAGVPVVASNTSCLPEVCGDAALLCDPLDPEAIADALHAAVSDGDLRTRLREAGHERIGHFSWKRAASSYLAEIEAVARGRRADG